ncbi:MAG: DUF5719 family protein [Microbacterium sp.]
MSSFSRMRAVRVAAGVVVAAASVLVAGLLVTGGIPGFTVDAVSVSAQPPATASVSTCAGPLLATGRDSTQADLLTDAAAQTVSSTAAGGATVSQSLLAAADVSNGSGPVSLTAEPVDGARTDLAAAASAVVADDDLAGFAASACVRAQMESWLVTGAATTGSADLVVIANPGEVAALVTLSVYGSTGLSEPAAGSDIVVDAGSQRVIPLAALALGEENPIIRVTSSQTPVQASVQSSLTRVLTPGGVDQVAAVGAPAEEIVIPGVPVTVAPGEAGASNVPTSLRLLAPASDGTATITVAGTSGEAIAPQTVQLTAGVPLQIDLSGLEIGTYTVRIAASTPITGAVWATTGFEEGSDFGWFTPAEALTDPTLVAVAPVTQDTTGPDAVLTLASSASEDQVVTVSNVDGSDAREVTVPASGVAEVDVVAGAAYLVSPDGADGADGAGVSAAVTFAGDGALAGYPVQPGDAEAAAILVYPR